MSSPWSAEEIQTARRVKFGTVLDYVGAYHKLDKSYTALDPSRRSVRVHVNYECRDFRFLLTEEKWLNELLPQGHAGPGGGGAIDFVRHLTGLGFVRQSRFALMPTSVAVNDERRCAEDLVAPFCGGRGQFGE